MCRPMTRVFPLQPAALLVGLCLAAPLAAGCKGKSGAALAKAEPDEAFAHVPVPPADGPKLYAVAPGTTVYERPSITAQRLGELRVGAAVARSKDAYAKDDCAGGWYAVRPRGFVCAGPAGDAAASGRPTVTPAASIDPTLAARGLPAAPDVARALPYRYARARSENVPLYARVPSPSDQLAAEPDLKKILGRDDKDPLGAAANDVPLDARGVPTGPPVLLPGGEGIDGGKRTGASYFVFGTEAASPSFVPAAEGAIKAGGLRKGSGVAITGSVELESISGLRRFAVTASGYLVPTDRLKPALGSTWHGIDLEKLGLPLAFVHKAGVHTFSLAKGKAQKHDDEVERRTAVPLTGKFRTVDGVRYEETRDGDWLRAQDLVVVIKRHKYPDFVKGSQRWIDVSIANQTLTAYEGTKPVYATLVSTGRDQLKDPATSASTPRGAFRVVGRHVTRALDPREVQSSFDVADAPWVLDLEAVPGTEPALAHVEGASAAPAPKGFALTGTYWSDPVGEAQSFHDVALTPIDAHRLWTWAGAAGVAGTVGAAGAELPEGWHAVYGLDGATQTQSAESAACMVFVRP